MILSTPFAASVTAAEGPSRYHGFTVRNTSAAVAATFKVLDGPGGAILETVQLAPSESTRECYSEGIEAENGIHVELVAGAVEGAVRHG